MYRVLGKTSTVQNVCKILKFDYCCNFFVHVNASMMWNMYAKSLRERWLGTKDTIKGANRKLLLSFWGDSCLPFHTFATKKKDKLYVSSKF